ncbi:chemotaxis protein MotA [Alphaproteobacteria bacterium]
MFRLGLLLVFFSVIVGFLMAGGSFGVLLKPGEWLIIVGVATGGFVMSNPKYLQKSVVMSLKKLTKPDSYQKHHYLELLVFLFTFFKHSNSIGFAELENHIENPEQSKIFLDHPILLHNKDGLTFFCDYFRIIALGFEDMQVMENMMEAVLSEKRTYAHMLSNAILKLSDSLPGIGIIAAVLGVIVAMRSAGADAAVLAARVASALIGTFAGVFLSYGVVGPVGLFLEKLEEREVSFLECMKVAIMSYIGGCPPSIAVEFARQIVPTEVRPSFHELEDWIDNAAAAKQQ